MNAFELAAVLNRDADRAENPWPVLEDFADRMKDSIIENFAAQGRPYAWAEVKNPEHAGHQMILVDSGQLLGSTTAFVEGNDVVLAAGGDGQPEAKAGALQYGAKFTAKRREGRFVTKRSRKDVTLHEVVIPARPYLLFQDDDLEYFGEALPAYIFDDPVARAA